MGGRTCLGVGGGFLMTPNTWNQRSSDRTQERPTPQISARLRLWIHCGSERPGSSGNLGGGRKDRRPSLICTVNPSRKRRR